MNAPSWTQIIESSLDDLDYLQIQARSYESQVRFYEERVRLIVKQEIQNHFKEKVIPHE
jgi:hypothetical protein